MNWISVRILEMNTGKSIRKEIGRSMLRLEYNIKMDFKGIVCDSVERFKLGLHRVQCLTVVNTGMNFLVP
jgi:hypothetical protein